MALSDTKIKTARPRDKAYKLFDTGGLFIIVTPSGKKWWRFKYSVRGKEKTLSMGVYPDIGLKDARERRDAARRQLAHGIDPGVNRKALKAAQAESDTNTFELVAREWLAKQSVLWAPVYLNKITRRLERDIFPWLGRHAVAEITAKELRDVLRRLENRGVRETAHRALQNCGQVFRHAIVTGRAVHDISRDLEGSLLPKVRTHFASITEPKKVAELMQALRNYSGHDVTRYALQLAPLVFVRPGELRFAEWAEINFDTAEWIIPSSRMKMKNPGGHLVPLSTQALEVLRELYPITGRGKYVFPSIRSRQRPMSDNTINAALRRLGFSTEDMTGHGFRAMARTILDEVLHVRPDYIEHQLAHAVRDPNGRAYNRTSHLPERKKMMQDWADYLDQLAAEK